MTPSKSTGTADNVIVFRDEALRRFCRDILSALAVPAEAGKLIGDALVDSNLRGVDSHGIGLLPGYVDHIRAGGVDIGTAGEVVAESAACLLYDGRNGLGHVVSDRCADHAIRLARRFGIAIVVVRNSDHFGAAATWGEKIRREGLIGIVMTNAGVNVAPWQGITPVLATNPICMTVPATGPGAWLLDMATSTVAKGKASNAADLGQDTIPAWWGFLDRDGNPTTQTQAALQGMGTPVGGYKGTGLAMMVEILCAVLSGGPMALDIPSGRTGADPSRTSHAFLAIDPGRFLAPGEFEPRMARLNAMVKSSAPARGYSEVLVAGEPENRTETLRRREGIPVPRPLWERLSAAAASLGVVPPSPAGPGAQG